MASNFLKSKAEERAKEIDKVYGKGTYGSTADLKQKIETTKGTTGESSSNKNGGAENKKSDTQKTSNLKSSTFLQKKVIERSLIDWRQPSNPSIHNSYVNSRLFGNTENQYPSIPNVTDYSSAVKYLEGKGFKDSSGILTEREWQRRKGKSGGTYKDYLDERIYSHQFVPLEIKLDGETTTFGKLSIDAYKAIEENNLDKYVPKNETEKKTISNYLKFAEEYAKKQREPKNFGQGLLHSIGYTAEKVGAGAIDGISDGGKFLLASAAELTRPFVWGSWDEGLKNYAEKTINDQTLGDVWNNSVESRYRVPDWYRNNMGDTSYNFGSMIPAIAAEVATASTSPLLEANIASQVAGTGAKGTIKMAGQNIAKHLAKPKPSDVVFGLGAAGSAAEAGYKQSGDVGKALNYGVLSGLGEVATERLFGGLGGTGIGADELIDLGKVKGLSKIANNKYGGKILDIGLEGVEEVIMAAADPALQKITVDPNAKIPELKEIGESGASGVLLSAFSNVATFPLKKYSKNRTINILNKATESMNGMLADGVPKIAPLKHNATYEEMEARQKVINGFKDACVSAMEREVDGVLEDDVMLDALIDEGKALGGKSANIAEEIEIARENGKDVTRDQVKKLIASNEVYKADSTEETSKDIGRSRAVTVETKRPATIFDVPTMDKLTTGSYRPEIITTEQAKAVTGFGDNGAELVTNIANVHGVPFNEVASEVMPSYMTGFNNPDLDIKKVAHTFTSKIQEDAYTAGQKDSIMQGTEASAKAKNIKVYGDESGVVRNIHSTQYTPEQIKMSDTIGKDTGTQVSFEEKLLVDEENQAYANAQYQNGEIKRASDSDNKFIEDIMEESLHRIAEVDTEAARVLMRSAYEFLVEEERSQGTEGAYFYSEKALYDKAGATINTRGIAEEVSLGYLSTELFKDEKQWLKWRERLDADPELRTAWQKLGDAIAKIIEKIRRLLKEKSFSKETRAKVNKDLETLERFRNLYGEAYKATRDAVAEKTNEVKAKTEAKATVKTETRTEAKTETVTEATEQPTTKENKSSHKETPLKAKSKPKTVRESVKVGDTYTANATGKTYTVTKRTATDTTYTVTAKNGKTTTRTVKNSAADANFNRKGKEGFTKVEGSKGIKAGDVFTADKATYKIVARDTMNTTIEITSEEGTQKIVVSNEIADKNFSNMSPEGITKWIDESDHIDNRDWDDVGDRKVKAFQYLFPEMQEYYKPLARELIGDLDSTTQGERMQIGSYEANNQEWIGVKRFTSDAIATIKDSTNASYDDIRNALNRLIEDEGQENIALAKRIELVFDDMLTKGYKTFEGMEIPPNEEYITKKEALIGKTYEGRKSDEVWDDELLDDLVAWGNASYSLKVTDQKTINFLENQEHITTYKAMQLIDGKLYPPMAAKTKGADGKYHLNNASEIGVWQQAVEDPSNIKFKKNKDYGYYVLNKGDGSSVEAAYNPYEHSSNLVLNDQFEGAYKRNNLVTVECVIPKSELTSGYKAQYAKDTTGVLDWKSGVVAGKIKDSKRKVYLSRYLKPVRIVSDAETATMYKEALGNSNISVPFNVVTPSLLSELEKIGVSIDYEGSPMYKSNQERNKAKSGRKIAPERVTSNILDTRYSLKYSKDIAKGQIDYINKKSSHITLDELEEAQKVTHAMVDVMMKYSSILPEDKIGKVLTKNGSYDRSVENTTICVRTLAYNEFVDKVQEELGRPLTQMESFLVSQKLYDIATEPQCLYCYVSLDRKAFNDMLLRYMQDRDTVIAKYNKSDKSAKAINKLYEEFLNGRKDTKEMKARFNKWINYVDNGTQLLSLADIATDARQSEIKATGGNLAEQLADARKYAQSASWSKIQKNYVAYRDEILKLGDRVVKNLNEHYGLRWYSFSDYSAAFIVENMQQITDASIRGLKGLAYTKDTDFVEIFAPSGMNINISVFVNQDEDGNFYIDEKQSANFEQAIVLRELYPNVGIVATVTNDEALRWVGEQEWSDVIIPFHIVRTGTDVAEYYKWLNYTSESGDTIGDKDLWNVYVDSLKLQSENARKKVSKNIYPSEHQNDKGTYLALCESRGLTPRFARFAGEEWYMKLVNETRLSANESSVLKPEFNLGAAKQSFQKFVDKGGYEGGWYKDGVSVDEEAKVVASDVLAGKKANEVDYGRQDRLSPENLIAKRKKIRTHGKAFSLKGGVSTKELRETLKEIQKGNKKAIDKLSKYAEEGIIRTEQYDALVEKYGIIPSGERPHREIFVPAKTGKGKKVSHTVRTILEARVTPDTAVPTIEKMVEDGVFSYDVYTDKEAIKNSETYIKTHGWNQTLVDWFDAVNSGEVSKDLTTTGWALYNNAATKAATETDVEAKKEATQTAVMILDAMVRHQRSAAQALQATRILKKLSPDAQLYAVQRSVESLQNELKEKYGKKAPNLEIDVDLAEKFLNAKTEEERLDAEIEIYRDIGRQMPSTFMDKWNAWRYLAMLGNLRTHGRNILGNAFFAPVVATKNLAATTIESIVAPVVGVSGKKMLRGKKFLFGNKADRALLKAAWNDYANVADAVSNGGKYNDSAMANKNIQDGRRIFKFKPLEWARKKNSELLEGEDILFSKPHYAYALAQYCKANNITPEQIQRGKAIAPARDYAIREAQKATYKDTNAFSQFVSSLGRTNTKKNAVTKGASTIIEGILPFRKTPANILVRGVEYSPLGLLKGLSYDLVQVGKGKMTASEAIDNISAGLTGTGLLAFGVYLAAQGLIRGHGEEDKEEKEFNEMMGHQAYSLELPNGQSITLDWLAPEALPFFVGVNIWETTKGTDEKVNMSSLLSAVTRITEPMLEMSCLQGLNDLVEGVGYASSNDTSGLMAVVSSAVTSYITQGLPTIFGQAERTGEEERMTTYTEKDDFLTGDLQYTLGKASAKIPYWDYNQIPYIDAWGRKEASGTALKRGLNNFLNPAYTSTIESSEMEKELLRLYEATKETSVFPSRADKYFMVDEVRKDLTADEYVRYATLKGEKSYAMVSELVASEAYRKLSNEEKVRAIEDVYKYANQKAKNAISNYKPEAWVGKADEFAEPENYLSFRASVSATRKANDDKITKEQVADIILDLAENDSEVWDMYLAQYSTEKKAFKAKEDGVEGKAYLEYATGLEKANEDDSLKKYEVVDVITGMDIDNDDAWSLYLGKYDEQSAIDAEKHGIDAKLYMSAVVDMGSIQADYIYNGKRVDGASLSKEQKKKAKQVKNSRRAKVERYLYKECDNTKEFLFLLGTEYSSIKKNHDYIKYFGKE